MEAELKSSMLEYYDERAEEYDQLYSGRFSADANVVQPEYAADTAALQDVVRRVSKGCLLDAPCGTGFWLPCYASKVRRVVLMDQSRRMLDRARSRVQEARVGANVSYARGDILDCTWPTRSFDTAVVGFFLSHLTDAELTMFLTRLTESLRPEGCVILLDSLWTPTRARDRAKEGVLRRRLNDGREYELYKRYFEAEDVRRLAREHGCSVEIAFEGSVFFAATFRPHVGRGAG